MKLHVFVMVCFLMCCGASAVRIACPLCACCAAWEPRQARAQERSSAEINPSARELAGSWSYSEDVSKVLRFQNAEREDAVLDHPSSFVLTIDRKLGVSIAAEKLKMYG